MNPLLSKMLASSVPSQVAGLARDGKKDKAALVDFLLGADPHSGHDPESPCFRTMPRTMLRYAIEKFPEAERQHYLAK